ncbi:glycosyltransferase family 4 protein [Neobacillus sp. OS1-32]|uniref:Glycosyltransferase family 4 protein n=1 Tax=Neobacillus paridis TaxID=2803862 RepID=A0ABS1TTF9_9BACI|nr:MULTISPECIES: glycosyltransferase family 4 protein [Neobacillus]MBL4954593.1 glycosyltransferase family 4 protein [Neobacillus paridis]WML29392.1 glycosyltransferase family 4 protein [Neobacillus sp. OS1-32]
MNIVHAPTEIAGQMGIICKELRKKGHHVAGYNCFHTYLNYKGDIINTDAFEILKEMEFLVKNTDIFHFHNANTLMQDFADLPLLKANGKKMIMHHWGSDVRSEAMVKKLNPYPLPPTYYTDEEIHKQLTFLSQYIDTAIVQDYETYPYVKDYYKNVFILPLACNVEEFEPAYPSVTNHHPVIIHAPTNRAFKGSDYVEAAMEQIQGKAPFTFKILEKMSHEKAIAEYKNADIIIDQLLCGTYGMFSVEAMAMGKPVVAFIRDDVRSKFPDELPIVQATPETLADVLLELIQDPQRRYQLGVAGRKYVETYHSGEKIASELLSIYQQL